MHFLSVDDNRAMRTIIRRSLSQSGLEISSTTEASHAREALQHLEANPVDVVLLDFSMPEVSGIELYKRIKEKWPSIHAGFITADATPELRASALQLGASFMLGKPFTDEDMLEALQSFYE